MFEWSYDMGDNKPLPIAKFSSTARAMALRDETIYRASNNVVELCNLNCIVRQKMTFSEGEGSPTHLDVNGQFLAVATDTGLIKLFKVTRREPKQLGSPGHFNLWAHAQNLVPSISISTESQRIHCKTSQGHQATQTQEKSKVMLFVLFAVILMGHVFLSLLIMCVSEWIRANSMSRE